jgi:hypothetical protein
MNTPKHRLTALCVAVALAVATRNSDSTAGWHRIE